MTTGRRTIRAARHVRAAGAIQKRCWCPAESSQCEAAAAVLRSGYTQRRGRRRGPEECLEILFGRGGQQNSLEDGPVLSLGRPAVFGGSRLERGDHLGGKVPDQQLQHDINDITARQARPPWLRGLFHLPERDAAGLLSDVDCPDDRARLEVDDIHLAGCGACAFAADERVA